MNEPTETPWEVLQGTADYCWTGEQDEEKRRGIQLDNALMQLEDVLYFLSLSNHPADRMQAQAAMKALGFPVLAV